LRQPIETAPKDGTIVQLLVQFVDHPPGQKSVLNGAGPLYDTADPCWTIGGNTVENTGVDHWQFVGWNWEQDCFVDTSTDSGHRVLGWAPFDVAAPAAPAVDAPIVWPKARDVGRIGDMSPSAHLRIGLDSDNDVYASIYDEHGGGSIEFCTPGAGGGKSSRTRKAMIALMVAMEADNAADPRRDWWAERNLAAQAQQKGPA